MLFFVVKNSQFFCLYVNMKSLVFKFLSESFEIMYLFEIVHFQFIYFPLRRRHVFCLSIKGDKEEMYFFMLSANILTEELLYDSSLLPFLCCARLVPPSSFFSFLIRFQQ